MPARRTARPNVQKSTRARAQADAEQRAETAARWAAVLDQPTLPFTGPDAELVDGYTRVQTQREQLAQARALTSRCTCTHGRDQHTTARLVCSVSGCSCSRFRR